MLLTKIWTAILALLATMCLAGMFLLSVGSPKGFSDANRTAVEAVTEAGLAALTSDIESSRVSMAPSLLNDTRLKTALEQSLGDTASEEGLDLQGSLSMVAYEGLLVDNPGMSVALIDKNGTIAARTGLAEQLFDELTKLPAFKKAQNSSEDERPFSANLGGSLHAVKVSRPETSTIQRRLVAIHAVDLGAGSFFRRVIHANPAALVRDGAVIGETIGGAKPENLIAVVAAHSTDAPKQGASQVFEIGQGSEQRLGALGRVPGPAGDTTHLVVLSRDTAGASQTDLATAINDAKTAGGMAKLPWPILIGVLVLGLALAFYLPHLEGTGPLSRLEIEFKGIAAGTQHQIFHDSYGGKIGEVARAAVTAHEAMHLAWQESMLEDSDAEDLGAEDRDRPTRTRGNRSTRSVRSTRNVRGTRRNKALESRSNAPAAIDLPTGANEGSFESHSHSDDAAPAASSDARSPGAAHDDTNHDADLLDAALAPEPPSAPAPTLHDEAAEATETDELATGSLAPSEPPPTADPKETYFREIYEEFVSTKKNCGESITNFAYEKFAKKLRKNTTDLMKRDGITDVKFTVYVKDGRAALKAKVVKG